jgi:hypothetical protein
VSVSVTSDAVRVTGPEKRRVVFGPPVAPYWKLANGRTWLPVAMRREMVKGAAVGVDATLEGMGSTAVVSPP